MQCQGVIKGQTCECHVRLEWYMYLGGTGQLSKCTTDSYFFKMVTHECFFHITMLVTAYNVDGRITLQDYTLLSVTK